MVAGSPVKYLILGCPEGQLGEVLRKAQGVNEKNGPFAACFVLGGPPSTEESDLTALFDLVKHDWQSSFPVYFVAGRRKRGGLEASLIEELALRNVHFARPFGISRTVEGLSFAYIGGVESAESFEDEAGVSSHRDSDLISLGQPDVAGVEEEYQTDELAGIDILFTWSWPADVADSAHQDVPTSRLLRRLALDLKPRYVFAPSHSQSFCVERAPYENTDSRTGEFLHATRFIALAPCLNDFGKKWIYALSLVPFKHATVGLLTRKPESVTENPLKAAEKTARQDACGRKEGNANNFFFSPASAEAVGVKRRMEDDRERQAGDDQKKPPQGYVCKRCHSGDHFFRDCKYKESRLDDGRSLYVCHICHEPGHYIRECPKREERSKAPKQVTPDSCWFCLANPATRKHLIVDIGEEAYVALAKGPLTPDHLLIVPVDHVPGDLGAVADDLSKEICQWQDRLIATLSARGLVPIFFRLVQNASHHWHMQMVPVEADRVQDFIGFLHSYSKEHEIAFVQDSTECAEPSVSRAEPAKCFFEFMIWEASSSAFARLRHVFETDAFFPAQFGRQALAAFLGVKEAGDWRRAGLYTDADERTFAGQWKGHLKS